MHLVVLHVLDLKNAKTPIQLGYSEALVVLWPFEKTFWKKNLWLRDICQTQNFFHLFFLKTMTFVSNFLPALGKRKLKRSVLFWANSKRIKNLLFSVKTLEPKKVFVFFFFQKKRNKHRNFFLEPLSHKKPFAPKTLLLWFHTVLPGVFLFWVRKKKGTKKCASFSLYFVVNFFQFFFLFPPLWLTLS